MTLEEVNKEISRLNKLRAELLNNNKKEIISQMKKNIGLCAYDGRYYYKVYDLPYTMTGNVDVDCEQYPCFTVDPRDDLDPISTDTISIVYLRSLATSEEEFLKAFDTTASKLRDRIMNIPSYQEN